MADRCGTDVQFKVSVHGANIAVDVVFCYLIDTCSD